MSGLQQKYLRITANQRARALDLLRRMLNRYDDWIVINMTLDTLARDDSVGSLRDELRAILHRCMRGIPGNRSPRAPLNSSAPLPDCR